MLSRPAILSLLAALALVLLHAPAARGQDGADSARHWPLAKISFPVDLERVQAANPRPVGLRFYARTTPRGKFDLVGEKKPDELDEIEDLNSRVKKRGFHYTSGTDGRVDFALQYVFANGEAAPATANLTAQYRIVFDTRQPLARIATTGPRSVKWSVDDENLVQASVRLEVRSAGGTAWTTVTTREFGASDAYTWAPFDRNRVLEVRVVGKDRAGHEGVSNVVRISGGDGAPPQPVDPLPQPGGARPPGGAGPGGPGRIDTGFGGPDDFPNRPQIEYVNDKKLVVRSKPTRVTRSGIPKAVLWMKEQTGQWQAVGHNDAVNITLDDINKEITIPYEAKGDGLYHFVIQPINGAGQKPADPRDGDPAHWIVEVDTTPPKVTLKGAKAVPGGLNGPRVEIDYAVVEKNPMPDPITIEYTTDPQPQAKTAWTPVAAKVPNTGKYVWEIEDRNVWKFHLRVTVQDRAGNSGSDNSKDFVTVDLDTPGAVIERIDKAGGPRKNNWRDDEPGTIPPTPTGPPTLPTPPMRQPDPPMPKPEVKPLAVPPSPKQPDPKKGKSPKPEEKKTKTSAEVPDLPVPSGNPAVPPTLPVLPGVPGGGPPGGDPVVPTAPPAGPTEMTPPPVALPPSALPPLPPPVEMK